MDNENLHYRNWPETLGGILIILSILIAFILGFVFRLPGTVLNWLIVAYALFPGLIIAGVFLAIGAVISRLNVLLSRNTLAGPQSATNKAQ